MLHRVGSRILDGLGAAFLLLVAPLFRGELSEQEERPPKGPKAKGLAGWPLPIKLLLLPFIVVALMIGMALELVEY